MARIVEKRNTYRVVVGRISREGRVTSRRKTQDDCVWFQAFAFTWLKSAVFGIWSSVEWYLPADVSMHPIGPIFDPWSSARLQMIIVTSCKERVWELWTGFIWSSTVWSGKILRTTYVVSLQVHW